MSSDDVAIRVRNVSKHYLMFARPEDRLKQMVMPRLQRLAGRTPSRYYRDFAALEDVSFDIRRGETVGIIGRNGSGKSTLLQIVCGTLPPTGGTVEVNGRIAALLELGAGFNPEFTGRENVYLNATILGLQRAEIDACFDDIARFADIGDFIEQPVKTYSSGMYVRLAFATTINVDPDILVVDEALSVGDEAFQRKCFARIEQIKERGGTILLVSHGSQTIVQLCDRAMLFDGGELLLEGPPKSVVGQYQRLVNASSEAAPAMRAEILHSQHEPDAFSPGPSMHEDSTGCVPEAVETSEEVTGQTGESFDPNLVSRSRVEYESHGARICNMCLLDSKGEPANILQTGRRYVYQYHVDFDCDCSDVAFGMGILTVSGFSLGGSNTVFRKELRLPTVKAGQLCRARFEFICILRPGSYVLNSGVLGLQNGERIHLHRVIDALIFRVSEQEPDTAGGIIDFGILPQITLTQRGSP